MLSGPYETLQLCCVALSWSSYRILTLDDHLQYALKTADLFFSRFILPELTAKWFTNNSRTSLSVVQPLEVHEVDNGNWCYCKESKGGDMVACDNKHCDIKW